LAGKSVWGGRGTKSRRKQLRVLMYARAALAF